MLVTTYQSTRYHDSGIHNIYIKNYFEVSRIRTDSEFWDAEMGLQHAPTAYYGTEL
jgi:hypothetical protein